MPIRFTCPHCGTTTDVDDQRAGHSGPYAHCGKNVGIPPIEQPKRGPGPVVIILIALGVCLLILLACGGLLLGVIVQTDKGVGRRVDCMNNLNQIGLAMHNYHDTYGCFPPAFIPDENGKPKHSWRVLILPFLEDKSLYAEYRFDEPWNSPHNMAFAARMPQVYRCPSDPTPATTGITSYAMLVGPHAITDGPSARRVRDIKDGLSKTIMVAEAAGAGINWLEPRDLDVDKMTFQITHPSTQPENGVTDISSNHPIVANVLLCDGSVHSLSDTIAPKLLKAITTIDGGETVNMDDL
jgi:hypothetical protein